jgi:pimeloyl-ACP methyl ester carboxylesterase
VAAALVAVSGYLIGSVELNQQPLPPAAELGWWYLFYFCTERGRLGYRRHTHEFAKLVWRLASPTWDFDDATFDRSAASLDNPDHVDIVIHNYRWRLGLAEGDERYLELERKLAERPTIEVPTITIGSDFDGANADGRAYADRFTGPHEHRVLEGIGHNVPQEAPQAFAGAVLALARPTVSPRS